MADSSYAVTVKIPHSVQNDIEKIIEKLPKESKDNVYSICDKLVEMNYERFILETRGATDDKFQRYMNKQKLGTTTEIKTIVAFHLALKKLEEVQVRNRPVFLLSHIYV